MSKLFTVLVAGGRGFSGMARVYRELDGIHKNSPISRIVTGGTSGADLLAGKWARHNAVTLVQVFPDWLVYGKAAGPIRNKEMFDEYPPDLVVVFPGGAGAADCMSRARDLSVPVQEVLI